MERRKGGTNHNKPETADKSTDRTPLLRNNSSNLQRTIVIMTVVGVLVVVLVAVLVSVLCSAQCPNCADTHCGPVEGTRDPETGVYAYKGIPFAAAPVGARRWKQPVPLRKPSEGDSESDTCWSGVFKADKFGSQCPQVDPYSEDIVGDEDCLFLNIFTPTLTPSKPLPVLVYIHGGYLLFSNGSMVGYSPDARLSHELNAVFVSIQYRLNGLGFLVLDELGPDQTGNYGLWDQIEALRWVKDNINNFGGDPNQVTIFGQSSGGTSVWALAMAPPAKGLFHRVWSSSGSPILNQSLADASEANKFFLKNTGCQTAECLHNLTAKQVVQGVNPQWGFAMPDSGDLPTKGVFELALIVIDGHLFPKPPFEMLDSKSGGYSDVPIIIGTMAQEVDQAPAPGVAIKNWTREDYLTYVHEKLDTFGEGFANRSLAAYDSILSAEDDAEYNFTSMVSDLRMNCGCDVQTEKLAGGLSSPVYRYVSVSWPSSPTNAFKMGFLAKYAFHGWDMFAFFDSMAVFMEREPTERDKQFSRVIRENIMSFALAGTPSNANWKPYPQMTALIDENISSTTRYNKDQCDFWLENGFFSYSWIN